MIKNPTVDAVALVPTVDTFAPDADPTDYALDPDDDPTNDLTVYALDPDDDPADELTVHALDPADDPTVDPDNDPADLTIDLDDCYIVSSIEYNSTINLKSLLT